MITVGVDLAAEPKNTAVAVIDWATRTVRTVHPADDAAILQASAHAVKIGIDCPFGWPEPFVDFVLQHRTFAATKRADSIQLRREFAYRATDIWFQAEPFKLRPLSVSADRIAHAALRCAGLLRALDITDRSGAQRAVETYPAGSLKVWGLYEPGYKRAPARTVDDVLAGARLTADGPIASEHEADALVAGITAFLAHTGDVHPVPPEHADAARIEGWIALPTGPLQQLASAP